MLTSSYTLVFLESLRSSVLETFYCLTRTTIVGTQSPHRPCLYIGGFYFVLSLLSFYALTRTISNIRFHHYIKMTLDKRITRLHQTP